MTRGQGLAGAFAGMLLLLSAATGGAQEVERVTVVVATVEGRMPSGLMPTVERVRAQLAHDGRQERSPDVIPEVSAPAVSDARSLGRTAFSALGTQPADAVIEKFDPAINAALSSVSAVRDSESRGVLWNLCVLRVHLRTLSDDAAVRGGGAREAASDCARRFRERPPLGKLWSEEVTRTFGDVFQAHHESVAIKSVPAGCDALVYGVNVGSTPVMVDLATGPQEVQVACGGHLSALHRFVVDGPRDLIVRRATDDALMLSTDVSTLSYPTREALTASAMQDAATLAAEANAQAVVLVSTNKDDVELAWSLLSGEEGGHALVANNATSDERAKRVEALFRASRAAEQHSDKLAAAVKPVLGDYLLSAGLLIGGAALSASPLVSVVRDGECADRECARIYDGSSAVGVTMLAGAGVLVGGSVAILLWKPFGRRAHVSVGSAGIRVKGVF